MHGFKSKLAILLVDRLESLPVLPKLVFCGGSADPSATTLRGSANPHFVIPSEAEGPAVRLDAKQRPYE
jgi:hypothetical protein